jgi:hypothetical protein
LVTYTQADWATVADLLRPTPERLATAKAWLVERLEQSGSIQSGIAHEYALGTGATHPYMGSSNRDYRDPANQDGAIAYWQPWLDVHYAIYSLVQQEILVPEVQQSDRATSVWTIDVPKLPLGEPGQEVTPSEFPNVMLPAADFRWSIAETAQRSQRLELYDADLFVRKTDLDVFDERVRRCVEEALACYRNDLFLAAANMLGAASEAAWHQIADNMAAAGGAESKLAKELGKTFPSIAEVQRLGLSELRQIDDFRQRFGFPRGALDSVEEIARFWRDLRNYGMHPAGAIAPETFSQASLAVQIMGATGYLGKLAGILRGSS